MKTKMSTLRVSRALDLLAVVSMLLGLLPSSGMAIARFGTGSSPAMKPSSVGMPGSWATALSNPAGAESRTQAIQAATHASEVDAALPVSLSVLSNQEPSPSRSSTTSEWVESLPILGDTRRDNLVGSISPAIVSSPSRLHETLLTAPDWEGNVEVFPPPAFWPSIAIDGDGNAHAVWERDAAYYILYAKRLAGSGTWSSPISVIPNPGSYNYYRPDIAVGPNGNIHMIWIKSDGMHNDLYYASGTVPFTDTTQISSDPGSVEGPPSIAVDSNDTVHIAWSEDKPGPPREPRICYAQQQQGQAWTVICESTSPLGPFGPAIAADSEGNAYVLYGEGLYPGDLSHVYCVPVNDQGFGNRVSVTGAMPFAGMPDVVIDSNDQLHAVWSDGRRGQTEVYYSKATAGCQGWSPASRISDADPGNLPSIAVDPGDGTVYVTWTNHRGTRKDYNHDILSASLTSGESVWSAPSRVNNVAAPVWQAFSDIAIDPTTNSIAQAVWLDDRDLPFAFGVYSSILGPTSTECIDLAVIAPSELMTGGNPYIPDPMVITAVITNTSEETWPLQVLLTPPLSPTESLFENVDLEPGATVVVTWSVWITGQAVSVLAPYNVRTERLSKALAEKGEYACEWRRVDRTVYIPGLGPGPDFIVADAQFSTQEMVIGQVFTTGATIQNVGEITASSSLALLSMEPPEGILTPLHHWAVNSLTPGEATTVTVAMSLTQPGIYNLWFRADSGDDVTETNELNNVFGPVEVKVVVADECEGECPICNDEQRRHHVGGPIDTYSGSYTYQATDLAIPTLGQALRLERTYNSLAVTDTDIYSRPLGIGWTHNYDIRLSFSEDLVGVPKTATLKAPHGSRLRFLDNGYGVYTPFPGIWATLTRTLASTDTYTYTVTASNQEVYVFNNAGRLTAHVDPQSNQTTFTYADGVTLTRVTGPGDQRWLDFDYDAQGRLLSVADHTGRHVDYGYDADDNLVVVTDTLGQPWTYVYTDTHLLHEVVEPGPDPRVVERTFYDEQGRAVRQEDGLGRPIAEIDYFSKYGRTTVEAGKVITDVYTIRGVLFSQTDSSGNQQIFAFDDALNRGSATDANGNTTRYEYEGECGCKPTAIIDAASNRTEMAYNAQNNLTSLTNARGLTTIYEYDGNNLVQVNYPLPGATTVYTYNDLGQVTAVTDANGHTTRYRYDELGQRAAVTDALTIATTYEYDELGRVVTTTVAAGTPRERITVNEYDAADRLVRVTENYLSGQAPGYLDEYNLVTEYGYDPAGRLLTTTVAAGTPLARTTVNAYDRAGRLTETTENYLAGHEPGYRDEYNLITLYGYDPAGRLITTTVAAGTPLERVTINQYDEVGRLEKVWQNYLAGQEQNYLDQYNLVTTYGYDPVGNQTWVTDTLGYATRYEYDGLNRVTTETVNYQGDGAYDPEHPDQNIVTGYAYDQVGNQIWVTDTLTHTTWYEYDELDRVERQIVNYQDRVYDPGEPDQDVITRYAYDGVGNQVWVTDTLSHTTWYEYDPLNRVSRQIVNYEDEVYDPSDPDTDVTTMYAYDELGNRVETIDPEDRSTLYGYDSLERLAIVTATLDSQPVTTTYGYDLLGNRRQVTDAEQNTTAYGYDSLGRMATITDAMGYTTTYGYDLLGSRVQATDAEGHPTEYGYDSLGRMVVITATAGSQVYTTTYSYDPVGNRTAVTDPLGHRTAYGYDDLGRVITVTDALDQDTIYAYDAIGNRTAGTDAEGVATCYGHDGLNRLTSVTENCVTDGPSTSITNLLTVYTYDGAGNRLEVIDARGYTTTYTYDSLNRLLTAADPMSHITEYGYDGVGNRVVMTDANEAQIGYVYDDLNRLTAIQYPDASVEYDYDKVGNRRTMTDTTGATSYDYDDLYRLLAVHYPTATVGYDYNKVGSRTVITYPGGLTVTYGYDDLNRLETVTDWDGGVTRYSYDAASRLTGVSRPNGATTSYTYDDAGRLLELAHASDGGLLARYTYALDRVGNRVGVAEVVHYQGDGTAALPYGLAQAGDAPLDARAVAAAALPAGLGASATAAEEAQPPWAAPVLTSTMQILQPDKEPLSLVSRWPVFLDAGGFGGVEQADPTPTVTLTLTAILPPTLTPAPTATPVPTPTATLTPTPIPSSTPTAAPTATATPLTTPTATSSPTLTATPTPTPTATPTPTVTPAPTETPLPPVIPVEAIARLDRTTLPADGRTEAHLVVLVMDGQGNPVADGTPVRLQAGGGQVSPTESETVGGLVFARLRAGTEPGPGWIEVTAGNAAARSEFELTALAAGQVRLDDGSQPADAPLPFDLAEVVERARNTIQVPDRGLPFVERGGHRAFFGAGSLQFVPLGGRDLPVPLTTTVELAGVYAGDQPLFEGPAPSLPQVGGNAVRFERGPGLAEEYVARDGGVEQRLRIEQNPGLPGDLTMAVEVQTPLDLALAEGGEGFVFRWTGPRGARMAPVASYGRALALDAGGRAKRAGLRAEEVEASQPGLRRYRLEMRFPAEWLAEAQYPVVIDPLIGGLLQVDVTLGTQSMPAVAYDGTNSQYLVVWQDNRGGNYDIYGQLVGADGLLVGQNLAIRLAGGDQTLPDVAYNPGSGTYLVAWRSGTASIHAQRVDATGSLVGGLLDLTGILLYTADRPAVAYSSSAGYWLVTWQQWGGATNENDVRARAVSSTGTMAMAFTVYGNTGDDTAPDVAANGTQGFLVTWEREGSATSIYARRTTATGVDGNAFAVTDAIVARVAPRLIYNADDDQYLAAWQELSTGYDTVWGRRVRGQYDPSGQFVDDAFQVSDADQADCGTPAVTYLTPSGEDNGRYLVAWEQGAGAVDLYARWVLTDGTPSDSFTLSDVGDRHYDVALAFGPSMTTVLAAWTDGRAGNSDVYARSVEAGGDLGEEIVVHPAPGDQQLPQAAHNPDDDEYLVVWQDYRQGTTNPDIYGQRVTSEGVPVGENIAVNTASYRQIAPRVAYATQGNVYLVVWCHYPGTADDAYDVYGQRLSRTGQLQGSPLVIANESGTTGQEYPTDVVYNSTSDRFLVLWDDMAATKYWDVWGRHVSTDGSLGSVIQITTLSGYHEDSGAGAYDPDDDQYLIVWKYRASPGAAGDIQGRRMTGGGVVTTTETITVATGSAEQQSPDLAYLASAGRYVVAWEDNRNGNYDVYGQLVSPAGALDGDNYAISSTSQNDRFPRLAVDGLGGGLVAWQRDNGGSAANELYGRRLRSDGQPAGNGSTLLAAGGEQQRPAAASDGTGRCLLAWQDDRNGNWDIYGSLFEPLRAGFTAAPTLGAAPLEVEFNDQSTPAGAADEWRWAFGDGGVSIIQHPVYTYTQVGVYTVTQWVTDTTTGETDVLTRTAYITITRPVTTVIAYDYDPLYRLIAAAYSSGEVYTYTYDQVGNRLAMGVSGQVITYTYDMANRLTQVGDVGYDWDDNGNLLADGVRDYEYDYANRLVAVVSGALTTTFTYNGDGHRVAQATNGVTTTYVVAVLGLSQVLVETTGGETTRYVFGHDMLAEYDGVAWAYHLDDGLGSVRQLADEDGQVTLAQSYAPFGEPLWNEGSGTTGFGFTGERWEAYSQLLFLRARYYEPGTGRFLSRDTLASDLTIPRSYNGWLYVSANPVNLIDPSGLDPNCKGDLHDCTRQRMMEIISNTTPDRGEALFELFEDAELFAVWGQVAGRTCDTRLRWVLKYTKQYSDLRKYAPVWRLDELAGPCGFAEEFLDQQFYMIWYRDKTILSNQVGHFLAAVEMTYNHWDVGFIVGHEQVQDGTDLWTTAQNWLSYLFVSPQDYDHWFSAVVYDEQGNSLKRDEELWAILHFSSNVPFGDVDRERLGNSLQDLRLSLKGYRFAHWVQENKTRHPSAAGSWLRMNLRPHPLYLPSILKPWTQ